MTSRSDLEDRAAVGDPGAQFALGAEILSGPRAVQEGLRAIALVEAAAARDLPEALERCALFHAMGVGRLPDWERALDLLQRAAELGSRSAQLQMLLLADNRRNPQQELAAGGRDWAAIRFGISIDRLLESGERRILSEAPRIRSIAGFATAAECRWLIATARQRLAPAAIFDPASGTMKQDLARNNSGVELGVMDLDLVSQLVRARISAATRLPLPVFEPSQLLHYSVGQEFRPHHDFLDPANAAYRDQIARFGQRVATFLIYLDDEFEGGETDFPSAGVRYRGSAGDAIFFANVTPGGEPDPLTLHAGLPPVSGEKWIFSQWIRNRSPAAAGQ